MKKTYALPCVQVLGLIYNLTERIQGWLQHETETRSAETMQTSQQVLSTALQRKNQQVHKNTALKCVYVCIHTYKNKFRLNT